MDPSMMQGASITDVTNTSMSSNQQLTDPLICGTPPDGSIMHQTQNAQTMIPFDSTNNVNVMQYSQSMQQQSMSGSNMNSLNMNRNNNVIVPSQIQSQAMLSQNSTFMQSNADVTTNADHLPNVTGTKKRPVKGLRSQLFNRREPHNYDKTTPTQHQTNLYNQMLSQQNRNSMQLQQSQQMGTTMSGVSGSPIYNSTNYMTAQNVQTQIQTSPIQSTNSNYINALNLSSNNSYSLPTNQLNMMSNTGQQSQVQTQQLSPTLQAQSSSSLKQNSNLLSLLSMKSTSTSDIDASQADSYKASTSSHSSSYKPYPMQQTIKNPTLNQMPQRNLTLSNATLSSQQMAGDRTQLNTAAMDKEMFRSKSLPMNSTLQMPVMREEPFAVPKYQVAKSSSIRFRGRSNSMISKQQHHSTPSLQSATSEPMLKTLAQLLTASTSSGSTNVSNLQQSNVLATANVVSPTDVTLSQSQQQHQQKQPKSQNQFTNQYPSQFSSSLSPDHKFLSSPSTSTGESMQRRVGHIHAEQKRRYNIKNGFDMLHTLIPQLQQNPNAKLSKAAMLQKGAEYIRQLRAERDAVNQKMDILRKERDALNNSLK